MVPSDSPARRVFLGNGIDAVDDIGDFGQGDVLFFGGGMKLAGTGLGL